MILVKAVTLPHTAAVAHLQSQASTSAFQPVLTTLRSYSTVLQTMAQVTML